MKYAPTTHQDILVACTHGSHLYGTNTPASDHDFKVVTLPAHRSLFLAKPLRVQKYKFDEHGNTVSEDATMPANGYEAEHTPVQKFVHDYLGGQAYAVEVLCGVLQGFHVQHVTDLERATKFETLCQELATNFKHQNVNGMVGFAVKQTFDYVRRGERLNMARDVLTASNRLLAATETPGVTPRLDTSYEGGTVLDEIARRTGLPIGSTVNNNRKMRTLELNGRSYLETTSLWHFTTAVEKLIDQYGDRSTKASETDVDWKSLSHAVRVYEQVLELLGTGTITFPRPNAVELLAVKSGEVPLEVVKDRLRDLDDQVQIAVASSKLPIVDEEFRLRADDVLYAWLKGLY